jgi:hypothetical protein
MSDCAAPLMHFYALQELGLTGDAAPPSQRSKRRACPGVIGGGVAAAVVGVVVLVAVLVAARCRHKHTGKISDSSGPPTPEHLRM